jgi:hypothetical protein
MFDCSTGYIARGSTPPIAKKLNLEFNLVVQSKKVDSVAVYSKLGPLAEHEVLYDVNPCADSQSKLPADSNRPAKRCLLGYLAFLLGVRVDVLAVALAIVVIVDEVVSFALDALAGLGSGGLLRSGGLLGTGGLLGGGHFLGRGGFLVTLVTLPELTVLRLVLSTVFRSLGSRAGSWTGQAATTSASTSRVSSVAVVSLAAAASAAASSKAASMSFANSTLASFNSLRASLSTKRIALSLVASGASWIPATSAEAWPGTSYNHRWLANLPVYR